MKGDQEGGDMKYQWETILTAELTPEGVRKFVERAGAFEHGERRRPNKQSEADDVRRSPGCTRRRVAVSARTCR